MQTHVKVLAVLYIALSALFLIGALFMLLVTGSAAGIVGAAADPADAQVALPVIGIAGTALGIMLLAIALPGLITGWGLLKYKPWARLLGIVLSVLNLLNIPLGTLLGVYGLFVLLSGDTERLFKTAPTAGP